MPNFVTYPVKMGQYCANGVHDRVKGKNDTIPKRPE